MNMCRKPHRKPNEVPYFTPELLQQRVTDYEALKGTKEGEWLEKQINEKLREMGFDKPEDVGHGLMRITATRYLMEDLIAGRIK